MPGELGSEDASEDEDPVREDKESDTNNHNNK